ncbi:MAG: SRPBCC domain-containing protein [Actinomycetota bacterium]
MYEGRGDRVEREVVLPVLPPGVWAALVDPARVSAWFGATVEVVEARPGGRMTFRFPGGVTRTAVVEVAEPPRLLTLRWMPFEHIPSGALRRCRPGIVEFALSRCPEGTRLRVTESAAGVGPPGHEPRALAGAPRGGIR